MSRYGNLGASADAEGGGQSVNVSGTYRNVFGRAEQLKSTYSGGLFGLLDHNSSLSLELTKPCVDIDRIMQDATLRIGALRQTTDNTAHTSYKENEVAFNIGLTDKVHCPPSLLFFVPVVPSSTHTHTHTHTRTQQTDG